MLSPSRFIVSGVTTSITLPIGSSTSQRTEVEFGVVITASALAGDTYDFQIRRGSTLLTTYTVTPRVTFMEAAGLTSASPVIPTPYLPYNRVR